MANSESVTREILTVIGDHIKAQFAALPKPIELDVLHDFPEANEALNYPALSLLMQPPEFVPEPGAYVLDKDSGNTGDPEKPAEYLYRYVIGSYDWTIQADLWCEYKEQRHELYNHLFNAINSQFPTMGLSLALPNYYGILARYDMIGFNYGDDGEQASQTKEWRVKIDIVGHCKAILERPEAAIEQTFVDVENVNETVIIEE